MQTMCTQAPCWGQVQLTARVFAQDEWFQKCYSMKKRSVHEDSKNRSQLHKDLHQVGTEPISHGWVIMNQALSECASLTCDAPCVAEQAAFIISICTAAGSVGCPSTRCSATSASRGPVVGDLKTEAVPAIGVANRGSRNGCVGSLHGKLRR